MTSSTGQSFQGGVAFLYVLQLPTKQTSVLCVIYAVNTPFCGKESKNMWKTESFYSLFQHEGRMQREAGERNDAKAGLLRRHLYLLPQRHFSFHLSYSKQAIMGQFHLWQLSPSTPPSHFYLFLSFDKVKCEGGIDRESCHMVVWSGLEAHDYRFTGELKLHVAFVARSVS